MQSELPLLEIFSAALFSSFALTCRVTFVIGYKAGLFHYFCRTFCVPSSSSLFEIKSCEILWKKKVKDKGGEGGDRGEGVGGEKKDGQWEVQSTLCYWISLYD